MRVKGVKANSVIATLIFIGITAFAFTFHSSLFPVAPASAEPSYATSSEVGINVKESIKIAVDKDHLALVDGEGSTQIAPSASGTLVTGDVNVAVTTNAYGGYRLGVYTSDATTDMKHNNTSVNAVVSSIAGASGYDATTGMSSLSPNTWGFRKYTEASNVGGNEIPASWSNWYGVGNNSTNMAIIDIKDIGEGPSTYCNNLSQPVAESGCSSSSYDTYKVGFGANLTSSLPAGTYTNNIIFSALTNEASTFLTFNANAPSGTTVSGSMAPKSILKGSTVTLPNTATFKRDGFGIKGWALTEGATTVASITQPDPSNPGSTITVQLTPGATVDVDSLISATGIPSSTTGPIPLYAVWDNAYIINFNANGGSGQMDAKSIIAGNTFAVPVNTLITSEYAFLGYSFDADARTATYEPGDIITVNDLLSAASSAGQDIDNGLTLYLIWDLPVALMQTFNSCATIPEGHTRTLKDSRDGQEYSVYHIPKDATYPGTSTVANVSGACIMTKDLNLGAVDSVSGSASTIVANGVMTLSPEDSGFTSVLGSNVSDTVPTTNVSITNGTNNWDTSTDSYSNKQYTTSGIGDYAGRGYYSWGAAMTICPKGWRIPTDTEYNDSSRSGWNTSTAGISKMANNNISTIQSAPWSFVLGGSYDGNFSNAGTSGYYWSAVQINSTNVYELLLHSSSGLLRDYNSGREHLGKAVRCITKPHYDTGDATGFMQDFDTNSLAEGESTILIDKRDGNKYAVKKFGSGNDAEVWMISNLTLGYDQTNDTPKGLALTSEDTNIPDNTTYYLPPAGYMGPITSSSTTTSTTAVNFSSVNETYAKVQYAPASRNGSINPQPTGYYNFYTASLGYSGYNTGSSSGDTPRDICPAGWQLPRGSNTSTYSFYWLDITLGGTGSARSGDTTVRDRYINDFNISYSGLNYNGYNAQGYWLSSTVISGNYSDHLGVYSDDRISLQSNMGKNHGVAVRCVAK